MYGGCRCNGYTTAFNAVENQHIPQQSQERHCSQDHQALAVDYIRICPDCGVVTH